MTSEGGKAKRRKAAAAQMGPAAQRAWREMRPVIEEGARAFGQAAAESLGAVLMARLAGGVVDRAAAPHVTLVPEQDPWPYYALGVKPGTPMEKCESMYRFLAKARHPDAGGSEVAMEQLNAAIEELRRREREGGQ